MQKVVLEWWGGVYPTEPALGLHHAPATVWFSMAAIGNSDAFPVSLAHAGRGGRPHDARLGSRDASRPGGSPPPLCHTMPMLIEPRQHTATSSEPLTTRRQQLERALLGSRRAQLHPTTGEMMPQTHQPCASCEVLP